MVIPFPSPTPILFPRWAEIPELGWRQWIAYDAEDYGEEGRGHPYGVTWLGFDDPENILILAFHNPPHSALMDIQPGMTLVLDWYGREYKFQFTRYQVILWGQALPSIRSYFIYCDTSTPQGDARAWELDEAE